MNEIAGIDSGGCVLAEYLRRLLCMMQRRCVVTCGQKPIGVFAFVHPDTRLVLGALWALIILLELCSTLQSTCQR